MAVERLELDVVTPERRVLSETVDEVVLPGVEGYLGVLPGHAPLLTALQPGEVAYRVGDRHGYLAVSSGFVEVLPRRVSILADTCERAEEIDVVRAERARDEALRVLRERASEVDFRRAEVRLKKALARLQVAGRIR